MYFLWCCYVHTQVAIIIYVVDMFLSSFDNLDNKNSNLILQWVWIAISPNHSNLTLIVTLIVIGLLTLKSMKPFWLHFFYKWVCLGHTRRMNASQQCLLLCWSIMKMWINHWWNLCHSISTSHSNRSLLNWECLK